MSIINTLIRNINAIGHLSTPSIRCLSRAVNSYKRDSQEYEYQHSKHNYPNQIITVDNLLELQETVRSLDNQVKQFKKNIDMVEYKLNILESKFRYSYEPKLGQLWTAHTLSELRNSNQ